MSNNNSEWEVKEDKVKIGTEWKDATDLKRSFIIELFVAIALGILCVYGFTVNIIFGVLALFAALAFILVAMGSISALNALGAKFQLDVKGKATSISKSFGKKVEPKVVEVGDEVETIMETTLTRTTNKKRQEVIQTLKEEGILHIDNDYIVRTDDDDEVGELSKAIVNKLEAYRLEEENCKGFKCKVISIEINDNGKQIVNSAIIAIK